MFAPRTANMSDIDNINKILDRNYGQNLANEPLFRIVWSDDQVEKRFGTFAEFSGPIFLREFSGLREVPKYPWIKHRWVLERWMPPAYTNTPEIPGTVNGSYEPVQVFEHANGTPVPVAEKICHEIIWNLFHLRQGGDSASRYKTEDQVSFDKEVEINRLHLEEAGSALIKDSESII